MATDDTNQATTGLAGISTASAGTPIDPIAALGAKYKTGDDEGWRREQQALATTGSPLYKIGAALEAFGAGYTGTEPLFLKLRRQQQLEQQQRQETQLKLQQMKVQQIEHANTMFYKSAEMLKDNPKAYNELVNTDKSPAAAVFRRVGVTTKDFDKITSPDYLSKLAVLDPAFHGQVVDALAGRSDAKAIDPNRARHYGDLIDAQDKATTQAQAEANDFAMLGKKSAAGSLSDPEKVRFNEYMAKKAKQDAEYEKNKVLYNTITGAAATTPIAQAGAGLTTPATVGAENEARQASSFKYLGGTELQNGIAWAKFQKPFGQLDQAQAQQVVKDVQDYEMKLASAKVGAAETAKLGVPEEVGKRTNIVSVKALRDRDAIVHPPAGITKLEMRKGDYVELSDKQMEGWNKLQTAKGQATLAFDTLRPYITAKTGAEAVSQAGRLAYRGYVKGDLPEIRAYGSMKDALASVMARFVEVGVLTNTDVTRWSGALPGFTETKGSFAVKERVFGKLYDIASSVMKDSLLGTDPAALQQKYGAKLGTLLNEAEKAATPEQLQDDLNTLLGGGR